MLETVRTFETERLILRPCRVEDADIVYTLMNTDDFIRFVGDRGLNSLDVTRQYIMDRMLPQIERLGFGNYVVSRKLDGVKIGTCGLYDRPGLSGIDIGFGFLPQYYGQGYAFEAAVCLRNAAFLEFNIDVLRGITVEENHASRRLLERLGLRFREIVKLPGDSDELMLYELKKEVFDKELK